MGKTSRRTYSTWREFKEVHAGLSGGAGNQGRDESELREVHLVVLKSVLLEFRPG